MTQREEVRALARVAIVVKGYPRLSETFIAQEVLALQRAGLAMLIVSLRQPTDGAVHDLHREITAPILYLPEYLSDDPARLRAARSAAQRLPGYAAARALYLADVARDPTPSRHRRWGQALVLAAELPDDVGLLYVHYLHTPASVTRYAAAMRGLPYAFSAHAKDIYTTPRWELEAKIADASWGVTCTRANQDVLTALADLPEKVTLVYHGLDLSRFTAPAQRPSGGPLRILSVCRAVPKKGLDDLLRALAMLPDRLDWRFEHVGGGDTGPLAALAERLGIAPRVSFLGAMAHEGVVAAYRRADVFALAARVAKDGDRDGLPNVIMEAMAMRLPVVSTRVSAVPEIVAEHTGLLVPPADPAALAEALAALAAAPDRRAAMGLAGERRVRELFSPQPGIDALLARFAGAATRKAA